MQFSQNALLWFHILYIFLHKNTIYCTFSYVPNQHYQIFMVQMDLVGTILRYLQSLKIFYQGVKYDQDILDLMTLFPFSQILKPLHNYVFHPKLILQQYVEQYFQLSNYYLHYKQEFLSYLPRIQISIRMLNLRRHNLRQRTKRPCNSNLHRAVLFELQLLHFLDNLDFHPYPIF